MTIFSSVLYVCITMLILFLCEFSCFSANRIIPPKSVWPPEFSAPFGLYINSILSPVNNASSTLFYNWNIESQLIDYPNNCIPLIPILGYKQSCKLYFTANNTYFSQPKLNIPCCKLFSGVGTIPIDFLKGFNYTGVDNAKDMYGNVHSCNLWEGSGFKYWTDINTGHDVYFRDGPIGGIYWAWGNFNVTQQPAEIFQLPQPSNICEKSCLGLVDMDAIKQDPLINLALIH